MALTKITGEGVGSLDSLGIGTSNTSSFYSLADNLVVGTGSGGNGITIYSGSADSGYIGFNDTASASMQGFIQYNHSGDYMAFAPNGSEKMRIDANGHVTMPSQSAFSAKLTSQQPNIAVSSTVTVLFATEIYDQNSDFNTSTYTFTAPVTGKYQLNVLVYLNSIDTASSYYQTWISTSNRTYYNTHDPRGYSQDLTYINLNTSVLADMDAGDVANVLIYQAGGTQQTDIDHESYFTGHLVC